MQARMICCALISADARSQSRLADGHSSAPCVIVQADSARIDLPSSPLRFRHIAATLHLHVTLSPDTGIVARSLARPPTWKRCSEATRRRERTVQDGRRRAVGDVVVPRPCSTAAAAAAAAAADHGSAACSAVRARARRNFALRRPRPTRPTCAARKINTLSTTPRRRRPPGARPAARPASSVPRAQPTPPPPPPPLLPPLPQQPKSPIMLSRPSELRLS